jgi:PhoH-like ATPase
MKGTTYPYTVMVIDEAEDLTEKQIRLIGTRIGEGGRLFWDGDYRQSLLDDSTKNPLVKMCNELKGSPLFSCITLEEDVRSETSKLFANLFE